MKYDHAPQIDSCHQSLSITNCPSTTTREDGLIASNAIFRVLKENDTGSYGDAIEPLNRS